MLGDTTFANHSSYNYGSYNNTGNGIFYRADTEKCQEWMGSRMRSYCDAGDPFCDVGEYVDVAIHARYLQNRGEELEQFIIEQFNNGGEMDGQRDQPNGSNGDDDDVDRVPQSAASGVIRVPGSALVSSILAVALL